MTSIGEKKNEKKIVVKPLLKLENKRLHLGYVFFSISKSLSRDHLGERKHCMSKVTLSLMH